MAPFVMLNVPVYSWTILPPTVTAPPMLWAVRTKVASIGTVSGASIAVMSTNVSLVIVVTPPDTVAVTSGQQISIKIRWLRE